MGDSTQKKYIYIYGYTHIVFDMHIIASTVVLMSNVVIRVWPAGMTVVGEPQWLFKVTTVWGVP